MVHHRKFYFLICKRIVERKTAKRDIILTNSKLVCLCKDDIYWGIPCRHQVAVFVKSSCSFENLPFNQRWLLTNTVESFLDDPLDLSPVPNQNEVEHYFSLINNLIDKSYNLEPKRSERSWKSTNNKPKKQIRNGKEDSKKKKKKKPKASASA